ncbi:glycosyltransferase [Bacteriovoracaceae bacterium]|nr:glycosyltransferase [Bacteriovoracaceae bacterium]
MKTAEHLVPELSVIMANYNGGDLISDAIESILNQTYRNFEFIIIDDGSADNSMDIIQKFQKNDERIKLIQNEKNCGLPKSLNNGIKAAKGQYIARQDSDDLSALDRFEKQIPYMKEHNLDLCGSGTKYISENGYQLACDKGPSREEFKDYLFSQRAIFPHGSAIFTKKSIEALEGYNEDFFYTQDMELWLRFLEKGYRVDKLDEPLYSFRIQKENASEAKIQGQNRYTKYLKEFYSDQPITFNLKEINQMVNFLRKDKKKKNSLQIELKYFESLLKYKIKKWIKYNNYF